jgi:hypothetical protein
MTVRRRRSLTVAQGLLGSRGFHGDIMESPESLPRGGRLLSISRHAPLFQPRLAEIEAAAAEEEHDENDED